MFVSIVGLPAAVLSVAMLAGATESPSPAVFELTDIFELEWASDPRISPDGKTVVYERAFMDVMSDRRRSHLWSVDVSGERHRPLTAGPHDEDTPRWSPDGTRVAFVSDRSGARQIHMLWLDTGQVTQVTSVQASPGGMAWSPDGRHLAFSMKVREPGKPFVTLPPRPEGATWAEPAIVIEKLRYRREMIGDFCFNACFRFAGIPYEAAERSLRLFAEKVLPALR